MGWLIALGIIELLAMLPLGVSLRYRQDGLRVWALIGYLKISVYPFRKSDNKEKKKKPDPAPEQKSKTGAPAEQSAGGGSWRDFLPLVQVLLDFLKDLRRKIRVRNMELHVTMAGEDPCDLAVNYGRMNIAMAGLLAQLDRFFVIKKQSVWLRCDFDVTMAGEDPCDLAVNYGRMNIAMAGLLAQLDRFFVIKKQSVWLRCDFGAEETVVSAQLDVTITVARLLVVAVRHGIRGAKTFITIKNQRESGAKR